MPAGVTERTSGVGPPGSIDQPEPAVHERPRRRLTLFGLAAAVLVAGLYLPHADTVVVPPAAGPPDSGIIYFVGMTQGAVAPPQSYELYAFSADRSSFREIVIPQGPAISGDIDVSPDGKVIAYSNHVRFATRNIYTIGIDGAGRRQITRGSAHSGFPQELHPDWSPDGERIVFSSTRCCDTVTPTSATLGTYAIHVVDADGTNIRQYTNGKTFAWAPAWSPDGSTIAYESSAVEPGNTQIWLIDEDGSNNRVFTDNARLNFAPAWSPDGERLAFVSRSRGGARNDREWQIRVIGRDGAGESILLDCEARCSLQSTALDWSPDGRSLVFTFGDPADLAGPGKLGVLAVDGSGFQTLDTGGVDVVEVSWGNSG